MKHHPAWLAAGLLVFVVLACNLGKTTTNSNSNSNSNSNTARDQGSGTYIKEIHMAKDDGSGAPGDETESFAPSDRKIHAVAILKEPKAGTQMTFAWWMVDAGGTKNEKIQEVNYTTKPNEQNIHGNLSVKKDWPPGKYKVQVFVNSDLDKTVMFTVE